MGDVLFSARNYRLPAPLFLVFHVTSFFIYFLCTSNKYRLYRLAFFLVCVWTAAMYLAGTFLHTKLASCRHHSVWH